jgi:serine/threonine protein kinase
MPLSAGTHWGPYEILSPIGAGGMSQVYKARDTRLGRGLAIEVSAEHFSERFEREALAIAWLNRCNICMLYDCRGHLQREGRDLDPKAVLAEEPV